MKIGINKIFLLPLLSLAFFACEKEEERIILEPGTAPALSAYASTLVLEREEAEEQAINFSWTAAEFGFPAGVDYTLQLAPEGSNFADPKEVELENVREQSYTVGALNTLAINMGLAAEEEGKLEVRVMAFLADAVEPLYSNTTSISLTPYSTEVVYPMVYVPGAYQGWDPATASTLISVEDNDIYEGYVSFIEEDGLEFKITSDPNWDGTNYGEEGEGVLSTDGGAGNLTVPEPGTYWITADLNALSWSATAGGWAIIGDATAGGWDTDTDMVYNREENLWTITTDLSEGTFKFRFDNDWASNYGLENEGDEFLTFNGPTNIPVSEAGTYTLTLDLNDEDNPAFTMELQE